MGTRLSQRIAHAKVSTGWTPWLNRDDPGGTGDFETRHSFTPSVCASASAIEARVVGSSTVYTPGSATPDNLHMFSTSDGLACRNADQGSGVCRNYEVRFFCGSNFTRTIQAESFSASQGVQVESTTDSGGGQSVGWIESGDWMAYNSINIPASGTYTIEYRVASPNSGGRLSLDLNGGSTVLGQINIPNTGGWQNWRTISHTVHINAGTYNFGIFAQTGGWNINWWRIRR